MRIQKRYLAAYERTPKCIPLHAHVPVVYTRVRICIVQACMCMYVAAHMHSCKVPVAGIGTVWRRNLSHCKN